uniref:Uncharacterized protein n=1 Tax=Arcella intermedia TaxID=1963864 RepID=A0A6B2LVQ4_9EUKA
MSSLGPPLPPPSSL